MNKTWRLGVEIGGTKLQLGIGPGDGTLRALHRERVDPAQGAPGILARIEHAYPRLIEQAGIRRDQISAAGVGFGGPVDPLRGTVQKSFQVPGWEGFPLADWLRERLDLTRVVVENDADAAGLAETILGAGQGASPLLYSNIGSGIGGALIVSGQIYRGSGSGALEIGHLNVPDPRPGSDQTLELEQIASGWAIGRHAREAALAMSHDQRQAWSVLSRAGGDPNHITAIDVAQAAETGDPDAVAILRNARTALAFALNQAVTLLAPRRIVLGGGVSLIPDQLWLDPIRIAVAAIAFAPFRDNFDIVTALLGEEVVIHGALLLACPNLQS